VIERKDVWKTEGFPIWRIETGKLLQKFDPLPITDGIVHKSASVVCKNYVSLYFKIMQAIDLVLHKR